MNASAVVSTPSLALVLDQVASLVTNYGFTVTGLGDRMVVGERPVAGAYHIVNELVFHRVGVGDAGWSAALFRRCDASPSLATVPHFPPVRPVIKPTAQAPMMLTTRAEAAAWLNDLRAEGLI